MEQLLEKISILERHQNWIHKKIYDLTTEEIDQLNQTSKFVKDLTKSNTKLRKDYKNLKTYWSNTMENAKELPIAAELANDRKAIWENLASLNRAVDTLAGQINVVFESQGATAPNKY